MCAATIRARVLYHLTLQAVAVVGAPSAFLQAFSYGKYNTMRFREACSCFGANVRVSVLRVRAGAHVGAHVGVRVGVLRARSSNISLLDGRMKRLNNGGVVPMELTPMGLPAMKLSQ